MNYFAHGRRFVDDPYFLAGTAVPDWLRVADRQVRVRQKHIEAFIDDADPRTSALARGIVQHHRDDAWFHQTPAFAELSWQFTATIRDTLAPDEGLRPSFLGHVLVEILLDAALIVAAPDTLEAYYRAVSSLEGRFVEEAINRMTPNRASRLGRFVDLFSQERFLWDYCDDGKLWARLNQVMRRVKLAALPRQFCRLLPEARGQVTSRVEELLAVD